MGIEGPYGGAELNAALAAAQGEFPAITKSKRVKTGSYEYSYAPLEDILDKTRPALTKHGLAVTQLLETGDHGPALRTELRHQAGGVLGASFPLPTLPQRAQELGSLLTYLRRYAIVALLGIATEDDDDGAQATNAAEKKPRAKKPPAAEGPRMMIPKQRDLLQDLFNRKDIRGDQRLLFASNAVGREVSRSDELTFDEARTVITALELYSPDDPKAEGIPF